MSQDLSFYDNFYRTQTDEIMSNRSIISFLSKEEGKAQLTNRLFFGAKVLELGSGPKSIWCSFLDLPYDFFAIDFSKEAISRAIDSHRISYKEQDAVSSIDGEYDLIVDSHLLHTITEKESREKFLANVSKAIKPGGRFYCELMMKRKGMNFIDPYMYDDETSTLYRGALPWRAILSSLDWEKELLTSGLKIVYLWAHSELHFEIDPRLPDPFKNPELLRVILEKV